MGHSGLIIFRKSGDAVEVDTFLLSCRIIGRLFDRTLFCQSLRLLSRIWPYNEIRASFMPTQKNGIVAELWKDYGFAVNSSGQGKTFACPVAGLKVSLPEIIQLNE